MTTPIPRRPAGTKGGPDPYVRLSAWRRYRREALAAFVALALAQAAGFWLLARERADRADQAAAVILVRCEASQANRAALRAALAANRAQAAKLGRRDAVRRIDALIATLPPITDCDAEADRILAG